MPRGPYQGTFSPNAQPTVVTAPDGLVFINGETDLLGCPSCKRKFDLNKYVTAIQVDLAVDSVPGSASITLSIPRHTIDDFYVDGRTIICPMMEVEMYAKGFFLVEGVPQYYPIFWGLVTEVAVDYSGGAHTVNITCSDILKWWELCKMNINAAFTQSAGQAGRSIFGNVLYGKNPYDVIWLLAQQSFGDVVVATGSLTSVSQEATQQQTFTSALGSLAQYWTERFTRIRSNLMLYGVQGQIVRGDSLHATYGDTNGQAASQAVRAANGGPSGAPVVYDPTSPDVVAFKTQFMEAGQINFWQSEYQTKLEIAQAAKDAIGYEFYMDVTGDIVFKPPFYNLDTLSNKPLSWIQDIDIINMNLSESEAEVVTQLTIQGNFQGSTDYGCGEETVPYTSVTDYHLLRRYGWRSQTFNSEFLASPHSMFYMGMDLLDRYNARRHRGTVTIPLRPELRLGFPVYLAPMDQIWYVSGISHSIQFGGQATTTLTLTARREKFIAPKGLGNLTATKSGQPVAKQAVKGAKQESPQDVPVAVSKVQSSGSLSTQTPTAKELQTSFQFELDVGEAAMMPPSTKQGADSPYAPMILRNPKNGRVMGYPNVVMAYTRPFSNVSDKDLKKASGQKEEKAQQLSPEAVKRRQKVWEGRYAAVDKELHTYTQQDATRESHLTNRYSYGLNSAGVYVYAHDQTGYVQEMFLYPRARLKVTGGPTDLLGSRNGSALVRPVSDSRGFEVIGHFRYGRGLSLRDGALILEEGKPNSRASVQTQVAIAGNLFQQLTSQSVSVKVASGQAYNPAAAVNQLSPVDLETSAVVNPNTKRPEIVPGTPSFVDAAPLGSGVKQVGVELSVEAGQLSRALTLNEMAIKWDTVTGDQTCACASSRGDLWFVTQGMVVKPNLTAVSQPASGPFQEIMATHPDRKAGSAFEQAASRARQRVVSGVESRPELSEDIGNVMRNSPGLSYESARKSLVTSLIDNEMKQFYAGYLRDELVQAGLNPDDPALQEASKAASLVAPLPEDAGGGLNAEESTRAIENMTQVESYLSQLYSALDAPHQELEKALRGELLPITAPDPIEVRFGTVQSQDSLSPPFSPVNRALGGDPAALALTASTAVKDVGSKWKSFGDKLKTKSERSKLQAEIDLWQKDLDRKRIERDRLAKGIVPNAPNTTKVLGGLERNVNSLNSEIQDLEKRITANQQQLREAT